MRKLMSFILSCMMIFINVSMIHAENEVIQAKLYSTVTDAGEVVDKVVLDYGNVQVGQVDKDTYKVHVKATYGIGNKKGQEYYDLDRTIVKIDVQKNKVTLYMNQSEGSVLAYDVDTARNYPADLNYTITQEKPIEVSSLDGRVLGEKIYTYTCDNMVSNEEISKFESVKVPSGINYQYYDAHSDKLIVFFHGNGEGDVLNSQNNVAQLKGNRGGVSLASSKNQSIFKNASVMAFQAPDTWYYAQRDDLLTKAYDEIMNVVKTKNINPKNIALYGLSAGGYMSVRMLIKYPQLFCAAMINCPALDVASSRGGETPTDAELESIKNSPTPIWLVQGKTDSSVKTEDCSIRLFNILTKGQSLKETVVDDTLASGYTTKETKDNKYKLTLYNTFNVDGKMKLAFAEDYDLNGIYERVYYSDHWSWIYTLNNNPKDAQNVTIFEWLSSYFTKKEAIVTSNDRQENTKTNINTKKNTVKKIVKKAPKQAKVVKTSDNLILPFILFTILTFVSLSILKKLKHN